MNNTDVIKEFHAHVYFDAETLDKAKNLCYSAEELFGVKVGRFHEKLVGPHPRWSCQLTVMKEKFGEVIPWLSLNRNGLTIFVHAQTDDPLKDHTEHPIWMGTQEILDIRQFLK